MMNITKKEALSLSISLLNTCGVESVPAHLRSVGDTYVPISELVAKLQAMLDLEKERASAPRKMTATQTQNIENLEIIKEVLSACTEPVTIADLLTAEPLTNRISTPQKMSALLTKLVNSGEVVKTYDKRKAYFSLA